MSQQEKNELEFSYDPNRLLDALIRHMNLKNDAALCRALEVPPPYISKLRNFKLPIGASILIRMNEVSHIPIRELRELMGDRRAHFRPIEDVNAPHFIAEEKSLQQENP